MKKFIALSLSTFLINAFAAAEAPVFTTLVTSGKDVFAGVKKIAKGMEPETYLLKVRGETLTSEKISLPADLIHREVVSIFEGDKGRLVVMTQRTVEQGDTPQLHLFEPGSKKWSKLTDVGCTSFAKVKVDADALTVGCLETTKSGEEVEKPLKITLKDVKLAPKGELTLPATKSPEAPVKAELIGEAFEWKELKVMANKKEKVFKP